jgi:oligopeptide transport system substrate-binding protein
MFKPLRIRTCLNILVLGLAVSPALISDAHAQDARALRRSIHAEPDTLDPHKATLKTSWYVLGDLYEGLTRADAASEPVPGAAQSWETSEDGLIWTFELRPGLTWSDGMPLTAEDFVAGLRRLFDPETASKNAIFLDVIANANEVVSGSREEEELGVRAVDDLTLEIELRHPAPQLPVLLAASFASPVPRHAAQADGTYLFSSGDAVSNGAFTLQDWSLNTAISLEKNDRYWRADEVEIDRVVYYPITNEGAALNRFRAGEVDIVSWFGLPQYMWLERNGRNNIRSSPALFVTYLVFNLEQPPFDDIRVRKALSLAIDRQILTDSILRLGDEPAFGFVPPNVTAYERLPRPAEALSVAQRRAQAEELMTAAGYSSDQPLRFQFRVRNGDDERRVALAIRDMWRMVGAIAEISTTDLTAHYAALEEGDFSVADAAWSVFDAPELFLDLLRSDTGAFNYGQYANAEFDAMLDRALTVPEQEERHELMARAESLMLDDQPLIPLYFNVSRYAAQPRVNGFVDNPADIHLSQYMSLSD